MFEEIENNEKLCKEAEKAVVILNSYRNEQDVAQTLDQCEIGFFEGDFESVYKQSSTVAKTKLRAE